ncbi:Fe-S oxidoreductase [Sulfodiicoccus acidiphilus]|nr:Fe-S oxidoreductase [Sulfodiicoccus acidiphilus]
MMPFPTSKKVCTEWATDIPRGGGTVIYTGCMYQLTPLTDLYANALPLLSKVEGAEKLYPLAMAITPSRVHRERAKRILQNVAAALKRSGVQFNYLYEDEPYSGTVLLELGFVEEFAEYAKRVMQHFNRLGVKKLITVDPHSHYAFSRYREFTNFDLEVVSYLQLIRDLGTKVEGEYVVHDSCLYSRFLGLRETYRSLIKAAGASLKDDQLVTGPATSMCCGAPIGPLRKRESEAIASYRAAQLSSLGDKLVVVCPLCYLALSPHFKGKVMDLAELMSFR